MFFLPRLIFQGQTLPPPSDSVWRPSWPLSCKPEGQKNWRKQFSFLDHHHLLGQEAKTNWRGLGKVHQLVWGRFISYFFRAAGLPNAYIWTCWSLNVFFTCNPHLLILSLGSLQMLQGFHTLSPPHQLSWLKRCLQIKGGGYATSEKAFVLRFLSQSSTFTFKLLILHLGPPGKCLAWRWRCSRVSFLVNFPGWVVLAFKDRGKRWSKKDGSFVPLKYLLLPPLCSSSSTFALLGSVLHGVCRSTKTEEDCTTKEAKSSFTIPCLPIPYFYLHDHDPPSELFWFSEVSCMELLAMKSLLIDHFKTHSCQCPPHYKYD